MLNAWAETWGLVRQRLEQRRVCSQQNCCLEWQQEHSALNTDTAQNRHVLGSLSSKP